jgi:hypothetical protein
MLNASGEERSLLIHRVLRWIAIVGIFYAVLNLVGVAVELTQENLRAWWRVFPRLYAVRKILIGCGSVAYILLLVGAFALFRWKRWGRTLLLWWAPATVLIEFAADLSYALMVLNWSTATSQPSIDWVQFFWSMVSMWLRDSLFPLLAFVILRQPEAASIFSAPPASGFEVIPLARRASAEDR